MNKFILPILTIVLALVIYNPTGIIMPTMVVSVLLTLLFASFGAYAVFFYLERPKDEREASHALSSNRTALLSVGALVIVAIVVQELEGKLDPVLVLALVVLVFVKTATKLYFEREK